MRRVRYFSCPENKGIFIRAEKVVKENSHGSGDDAFDKKNPTSHVSSTVAPSQTTTNAPSRLARASTSLPRIGQASSMSSQSSLSPTPSRMSSSKLHAASPRGSSSKIVPASTSPRSSLSKIPSSAGTSLPKPAAQSSSVSKLSTPQKTAPMTPSSSSKKRLSQAEVLQHKLEERYAATDLLQKRLTQTEIQLQTLQEQHVKERQLVHQLLNEKSALEFEIARLLDSQTDDVKVPIENGRDLLVQLKQMEAEKTAAVQQAQNVMHQLDQLKRDYELLSQKGNAEGIDNLKNELQLLKQNNTVLVQENAALKSSIASSENDQTLELLTDRLAKAAHIKEKLEKNLAQLSCEKSALMETIEKYKTSEQEMKARSEALEENYAVLEKDNSAIAEQKRLMELSNAELKKEVESLSSKYSAARNLEEDNRLLQQEVEKLHSEVDSLRANIRMTAEVEQKNAEFKDEVAKFRESSASEIAALKEQLQLSEQNRQNALSEVSAVRNQLLTLSSELESARHDSEALSKLRLENSELMDKIAHLEEFSKNPSENDDQVSRLSKELEYARSQHASALQEIRAPEDDVAELSRTNAELDQVAHLSKELENARSQHASALQEIRALEDDVANLSRTNDQVAHLSNELEKSRSQHASAVKEVRALEDDVAELSRVYEEAKVLSSESDKRIKELLESQSILEGKVVVIQKENEVLSSRLKAAESVEANSDMLRSQLSELEIENKKLHDQIIESKQKTDNELVLQLNKVTSLEKENDELKKNINVLQESQHDVSSLISEKNKLELSVKDFQSSLEERDVLIEKLTLDIDEVRQKENEHIQGIEVLNDENKRLYEKITKMENDIMKRDQQIETLHNQILDFEKQQPDVETLTSLKNEMISLQKELDSKSKALEALKHDLDGALMNEKTVTLNSEKLSLEKQDLEKKLDSIVADLNQANEAIQLHRTQLQKKESELSTLRNQLRDYDSVQKILANYQSLQATCEKQDKQLRDANETILHLQEQTASLQEMIRNLSEPSPKSDDHEKIEQLELEIAHLRQQLVEANDAAALSKVALVTDQGPLPSGVRSSVFLENPLICYVCDTEGDHTTDTCPRVKTMWCDICETSEHNTDACPDAEQTF